MTTFLVIAALLLVAAVGLLAWPLMRRPNAGSGPGRPWRSTAIVGAVLPAAAFVLYFASSDWNWDAPAGGAAPAMPDIQRAIDALQAKLAQDPGDVEGWKLLGRSATVTGDYALARRAFGEAHARTDGRDAEAAVGYAESLVLVDERAIDGEAADLFEGALALAPDNARALWYGGIVAYRRGDLALAQQRWVELQDHDLPPDLRPVLAERLAELERTVGVPASPQPAASGIAMTVSLAPSVANKVPPGATLFVFARRAAGGPPLAVQRRAAGPWPVTLRLSDADAMLPGTRLADGGPVTLVARLSASGQPIAASGDLFGETGYDFASARPVELTIDRIVP